MLIKMLTTKYISLNGFDLLNARKDVTYDIPECAACWEVNRGFALPSDEPIHNGDGI